MKPFHLVMAPVGLIYGPCFVFAALLVKHLNGVNPICYHRCLILFVVGIALTGFSALGTKKLFREESHEHEANR